MQILPNRYYYMTIRHGNWEKRGKCFHLKLEELASEERKCYEGFRKEKDILTHRVIFYDFEVYRVLEGKIKEDTEEILVLDMGGGKEYEFSLFKPLQN